MCLALCSEVWAAVTDRFTWDAAAGTLAYAQNLIKLRAFQHDGAPTPPDPGDSTQPPRANHNGGVMAFGPDRKLYVFFGDKFRWGPERIADTAPEAMSRLFMLPGAQCKDPEFSWKHVVAPSAIGFLNSRGLGPNFLGDLLMGIAAFDDADGGRLLHMQLTGNRMKVAVDNPALEDRVDDNSTFHEFLESASFVIGRDFGVVTDIQTAPNGNLYVVSITKGAVYEVFRR